MDIARLPAPSLQRLFNFLVFMFPKVRNAKRSRRGEENLTWRQAFIKAYMSRGERRRRTVRNTWRDLMAATFTKVFEKPNNYTT